MNQGGKVQEKLLAEGQVNVETLCGSSLEICDLLRNTIASLKLKSKSQKGEVFFQIRAQFDF